MQVEEINYLLKLLNLDDCCASTDPRSIRFFFLREELYTNPIKVFRIVMTDDNLDTYKDDSDGIDQAYID